MFTKYAFVADNVSFDTNGKINANGIFQHIFAEKFPARHLSMFLLAAIEGTIGEKGPHKITVELRDHKSNKLGSMDQVFELGNDKVTNGNLGAALVVRFQDVIFQNPGQYEFVIFADDRFLVRVSFTVQKITVKKVGEG